MLFFCSVHGDNVLLTTFPMSANMASRASLSVPSGNPITMILFASLFLFTMFLFYIVTTCEKGRESGSKLER
jgi:hypothetical protein